MLGKHTPLDDVARGLRSALPSRDPIEPLRLLGDGYRSMAVETPDGIVFRVAKNEAAAAGYQRERAVLPLIRSALPVAVPDPHWFADPNERLPFGAIGYRTLPGTVVSPQQITSTDSTRLAHDLAAFLVALHRVPIDRVADQVLPDVINQLAEWRDEIMPMLRWSITQAEYRRIDAWWEKLLIDPALRDYTPALIHGDLWYEHVLIEPHTGSLLGVLDWEAASIGDPARDLATQQHLGSAFGSAVIAAYHAAGGAVTASFDRRVQRWWELRPFDGILWAIRSHNAADLYESVAKLRDGPLFNRSRS